MKYISIKDHKHRQAFLKNELIFNVIKAFSQDLRLPIKYRFFFFYQLSAFYSRSSKTKISKRCNCNYRKESITTVQISESLPCKLKVGTTDIFCTHINVISYDEIC